MTCLLHIDASIDLDGSNTRRLSARFIELWKTWNPQAQIIRRDLGRDPAPPLTPVFARAIKNPAMRAEGETGAAWTTSQALTDEFLAADRYVIGMPMHILTVPSIFKAYVEQIFHEGRVFRVDENGFAGLLGGRKFLFFLSKGADYRAGAPLEAFDMLEPYLRKLLVFCGVVESDIRFVAVNNALLPGGADLGDENSAADQITQLAEHW